MKLLVVLALCALLVACTATQPTDAPQPTTDLPQTETGQPTNTPTTAEVNNTTVEPVQEPVATPQEETLSVDASEFKFTPNVLHVKKGTKVTINLSNSGHTTHGFGLPTFNVNQAIAPGAQESVTFDADKAGTYTFFCTVPCGSGHSTMRGTIVVE